MSHPLSVTIGESKIIERAFSAAGVTCHICPDPDDAARVIFKLMSGSKPTNYPVHTFSIVNDRYKEKYAQYPIKYTGAQAVLEVVQFFYEEFYNVSVANIVVAATWQAIYAHGLIADADRREDSIDSGDAIDRCYDSVRVILPEYTTSADIEPPLNEDAVDK